MALSLGFLICRQLANVGPADYNYDESISTLRYANRAKNIKNRAKINEDPKDALLRQFQKELEELRKQLADGGKLVYSSPTVVSLCAFTYVRTMSRLFSPIHTHMYMYLIYIDIAVST